VSIPSVIVFMLAVSGNIMWTALVAWWGKLHLKRRRRNGKRERQLAARKSK